MYGYTFHCEYGVTWAVVVVVVVFATVAEDDGCGNAAAAAADDDDNDDDTGAAAADNDDDNDDSDDKLSYLYFLIRWSWRTQQPLRPDASHGSCHEGTYWAPSV